MRVPKGYELMRSRSGCYAVPRNIYGLLNALQMSKDIDNSKRIENLIKSRHSKNPILKYGMNDWKRAKLEEI